MFSVIVLFLSFLSPNDQNGYRPRISGRHSSLLAMLCMHVYQNNQNYCTRGVCTKHCTIWVFHHLALKYILHSETLTRREYPTLTALTYVCRRRGVSGYTIIWKAQWCWKGPSILILNMSDPLFLYWFVLGGFLVTFWGEHIVNEHQWYIIATLYKYRRKWSIYIYIFILYLIDI